MYLPEDWAHDAARRRKAHVPDDVKFRTKPEIALRQIKAALMAGVARGLVLDYRRPRQARSTDAHAAIRSCRSRRIIGTCDTVELSHATKSKRCSARPEIGAGKSAARAFHRDGDDALLDRSDAGQIEIGAWARAFRQMREGTHENLRENLWTSELSGCVIDRAIGLRVRATGKRHREVRDILRRAA